ncbi:hypothetical protein ACH4UR_31170 [Streptomyces lydicus]|uniref:hypothetical protein n=1 Tax=Streptomyces lydicus TaxID=47763 RepID=UPI0033CC95E4
MSRVSRLGDTPEQLTAASDETVTGVRPAADLSVAKSADATAVTVGQASWAGRKMSVSGVSRVLSRS